MQDAIPKTAQCQYPQELSCDGFYNSLIKYQPFFILSHMYHNTVIIRDAALKKVLIFYVFVAKL